MGAHLSWNLLPTPPGRNFPELTKCEHLPYLAGRGHVHRRLKHTGHHLVQQHLLQSSFGSMCLYLEHSSDAPDGRKFPELTSDDRFSPRSISVESSGGTPHLSWNFLPMPPGGRNFPELTYDDRISPCAISMESSVCGTCTFHELSSYAPGGRNFPELTKCKHLPCLAGRGHVHHWLKHTGHHLVHQHLL